MQNFLERTCQVKQLDTIEISIEFTFYLNISSYYIYFHSWFQYCLEALYFNDFIPVQISSSFMIQGRHLHWNCNDSGILFIPLLYDMPGDTLHILGFYIYFQTGYLFTIAHNHHFPNRKPKPLNPHILPPKPQKLIRHQTSGEPTDSNHYTT